MTDGRLTQTRSTGPEVLENFARHSVHRQGERQYAGAASSHMLPPTQLPGQPRVGSSARHSQITEFPEEIKLDPEKSGALHQMLSGFLKSVLYPRSPAMGLPAELRTRDLRSLTLAQGCGVTPGKSLLPLGAGLLIHL